MVTLGGTAILAESSKPGLLADLEIADNRILACKNAIRVVDGTGIEIHHNRIRMLDKRDSDVAIYLAADDSLIERNDIRLIPAPQMPPIKTPDQPRADRPQRSLRRARDRLPQPAHFPAVHRQGLAGDSCHWCRS